MDNVCLELLLPSRKVFKHSRKPNSKKFNFCRFKRCTWKSFQGKCRTEPDHRKGFHIPCKEGSTELGMNEGLIQLAQVLSFACQIPLFLSMGIPRCCISVPLHETLSTQHAGSKVLSNSPVRASKEKLQETLYCKETTTALCKMCPSPAQYSQRALLGRPESASIWGSQSSSSLANISKVLKGFWNFRSNHLCLQDH